MQFLTGVAGAAAVLLSLSGSSFANLDTKTGLPVDNNPHVQSTSGTIIGHRAPNRTDTFEFLGVKYGKAPVGNLRFASPQRYVAPAGAIYNASNWNADCPAGIPPVTTFPNFTGNGFEIYNKFTAHLGNTQNEDCLALNIWTKDASCGASKPVFVFFHGGRFTIPGPHSPFYNGQYLADTQDVVVVTVSYRLGMFGFSGAPGIEQNTGLRDQRSAVEWLRDNVANFGGDPKRIIIFGQSAGGTSVDYWAYAYKQDPIVAGLISHSGTALSFNPNTVNYSSTLYYNVSGQLGCGTDPVGSLACLRGKNYTEILAAAAKTPALPTIALAQANFHPTIDNEIVFGNYEAMARNGSFARIPYLAGNGDYEAGFYRVSAYAANKTLTPAQWDLYNQRAFTCPTGEETNYRVQYGVPTWRYRYMGDWDNLRLYPAWGAYPDSGAYHGSDMSMIFGTAYDITGTPNTLPEELTSRYMQGAWAAFGRSPQYGLSVYGWPSYNPNTTSLVRLAYKNQPIPNFVAPSVYDSVCPVNNDPLPGQGAF